MIRCYWHFSLYRTLLTFLLPYFSLIFTTPWKWRVLRYYHNIFMICFTWSSIIYKIRAVQIYSFVTINLYYLHVFSCFDVNHFLNFLIWKTQHEIWFDIIGLGIAVLVYLMYTLYNVFLSNFIIIPKAISPIFLYINERLIYILTKWFRQNSQQY